MPSCAACCVTQPAAVAAARAQDPDHPPAPAASAAVAIHPLPAGPYPTCLAPPVATAASARYPYPQAYRYQYSKGPNPGPLACPHLQLPTHQAPWTPNHPLRRRCCQASAEHCCCSGRTRQAGVAAAPGLEPQQPPPPPQQQQPCHGWYATCRHRRRWVRGLRRGACGCFGSPVARRRRRCHPPTHRHPTPPRQLNPQSGHWCAARALTTAGCLSRCRRVRQVRRMRGLAAREPHLAMATPRR